MPWDRAELAVKSELVEATGIEARKSPRHRRGILREIRHRIRVYRSRPLAWIALRVLPRIYMLYIKLVFATSRVEDHGFGKLHDIIDRHGGAVSLAWHEELFTAVYGYPHLGFRPSTLASSGDAGEVITSILQRMHYVVFRGGSSRHKSRRSREAVDRMIKHMRSGNNVLCALTVDGSSGPAYRMKRGGVVIARECAKPIVVQRTWHKRCLRMNGWDRMAVPLPFNVITLDMKGPYFVPDCAHTREGLERFVVELENDLIELTARSYDRFAHARPPNLVKRRQQTKAD
ncbi:MAG: DUF374 domain-containing protein [Pseudomonadales bacterium]